MRPTYLKPAQGADVRCRVRPIGVLLALLATSGPALAQVGAQAPTGSARPFEITDNSFLVEEAFNQDPGIFQNLFTWTRGKDGAWEAVFTQEWPAPGQTHQLSYTIPFAGGDGSAHVGSVMLNYRFQALQEGPGRPAFSPRASLILPTGDAEGGGDRPGLQVGLPFSKQSGDLYLHANAGFTWIEGATLASGDKADLTSPFLAGSLIWRAKPMLNLMLETAVEFEEAPAGLVRTSRHRAVTVSPGCRGGWNIGDGQVIVGAAVPVSWSGGETAVAALTYLSYELPFMHH
jgi:hypothetical protein